MTRKLAVLLLPLGAAVALQAAPKLRLTQTALGPIPIAQGANGPNISTAPYTPPYAYNGGDGSISPKVTSSDSWLVASVGAPAFCQVGPGCLPIQISLQTASLAKGTYTGFVTVTDANAQDSPQSISVTVAIGGALPDQLTFYTPVNGSASQTIYSGVNSLARSSTQTGGAWLSVAASGNGSFQFSQPFLVNVNAGSLAAGDYSGNVSFANSPLAADNKNIPVALHVTALPIVEPLFPTPVQFTIAQGAAKQYYPVQTSGVFYPLLTNIGQGSLTYGAAPTASASGGNWLSIAVSPGNNALFQITADAGSLAPGTYQGTVSIPTNAANSPTVIPVQLRVLASGPPYVNFGVSNVWTNVVEDGLAPGMWVELTGNQFTAGDPQTGTIPFGANLNGTQVLINNQPVPIDYVSATQINLQVPYNVQTGDGTLAVVRNGQQGNVLSLHINPVSPVLLPYSAPFASYLVAQMSGTANLEGYPGAGPAHAGDALTLYGIGLGATTPAVTAGTPAPSSPLAVVVPTPQMCLGAPAPINPSILCFTPDFVGLVPGFAGLYQINVKLPANVPKGDAVPVFLQQGNIRSNTLTLTIH